MLKVHSSRIVESNESTGLMVDVDQWYRKEPHLHHVLPPPRRGAAAQRAAREELPRALIDHRRQVLVLANDTIVALRRLALSRQA